MAYWHEMDMWDWGWMATMIAFWVILLAFAFRGVMALLHGAEWPMEHATREHATRHPRLHR